MHFIVLTVHSVLRWVVVVFALLAIARALSGWLARKEWSPGDQRIGLLFILALDLQLFLGLMLYFFLSPVTHVVFEQFTMAMRDRVLRFWAVEHPTVGLLAVAVAHATRVFSRRSRESVTKHRRTAVGFTFTLLLILLAIPWPFLLYGRPLFPLR